MKKKRGWKVDGEIWTDRQEKGNLEAYGWKKKKMKTRKKRRRVKKGVRELGEKREWRGDGGRWTGEQDGNFEAGRWK